MAVVKRIPSFFSLLRLRLLLPLPLLVVAPINSSTIVVEIEGCVVVVVDDEIAVTVWIPF